MQNDFGKGKIWKVIMAQALPLMAAQLVHLLYNVVDRIYIGHLENIGSMALTGIGLAFPITTLVAAFTNLFATGGAPFFAIARGEGDDEKAELILSQVTSMLCITSVILFVISFVWRKQILYLFGASDASYAYADEYLRIYIWGTSAAMLSTGLNVFINGSGYPRIGMMTIFLGALLNLILDPILIYYFHMNVAGAALATVISQIVSCFWAVSFFLRDTAPYRIRPAYMRPRWSVIKEIIPLGTAGFVMQGTNSLVSIVCNTTLRTFGGDLYVGIMTVINSVREILSLPAQSISQGAQPVFSYNYGAKNYSRIKSGIRFMTWAVLVYTAAAWALTIAFPQFLMSVFTNDSAMIEAGTHSLRLYFFAFVFMTFQSGGQSVFTALRCSKRAIFFSLFRKVFMVTALTILLPRIGFGADGVYIAEPVSNVIGGLACFIAMYLTVYRKLPQDGEEAHI
ncbi:MAG TPA: MATE family efflux transporter [Erysipelotrichaceae bacterium]|nr:MATE family efflux transporter [Erysipelotrichaceae bacterium]